MNLTGSICAFISISVTIIKKKRRGHQFEKVGETAEVWGERGRVEIMYI